MPVSDQAIGKLWKTPKMKLFYTHGKYLFSNKLTICSSQYNKRNRMLGIQLSMSLWEIKIWSYCQGGYRAANAFVALKMLGYKKVKMYLGSWGEWGNRLQLPVSLGSYTKELFDILPLENFFDKQLRIALSNRSIPRLVNIFSAPKYSRSCSSLLFKSK